MIRSEKQVTPIAQLAIPATNATVSKRWFSNEFKEIQRNYISQGQIKSFCKEADILADKLIEHKKHDFAGIIMSALCKLTQYFPERLEPIAIKGYKIAEALGDNIHMLARLNDLRKIYYKNPNRLYDYVQVLYKQEKCLKQITRNYEISTQKFCTVDRQAASKEEYERMLAFVQTDIGKITKRKHPNDARQKLLSARKIFEKNGNKQHIDYINMLLGEIEIILRQKHQQEIQNLRKRLYLFN